MAFFIITVVLLILLIIAVTPITVGGGVYFDLDRKTAIVTFKLFGLRVFSVSLYELNGKLFYSINGAYAEELQLEGENSPKTAKLSKIIYAIDIKSVSVLLRYGAYDDPFQTALNLTFLNNLLMFLKPRVKGKTEVKTYPVFGNAAATLDFKIKISFKPSNMLSAVLGKGVQNG